MSGEIPLSSPAYTVEDSQRILTHVLISAAEPEHRRPRRMAFALKLGLIENDHDAIKTGHAAGGNTTHEVRRGELLALNDQYKGEADGYMENEPLVDEAIGGIEGAVSRLTDPDFKREPERLQTVINILYQVKKDVYPSPKFVIPTTHQVDAYNQL